MRNRGENHRDKIIIAGTGRAGTTFLMQLFTALGFNTGFPLDAPTDRIARAGLETAVDVANPGNDLHYVLKSPFFADHLGKMLSDGRLHVHAAILPLRRLFDAAESRRRIYREAGPSAQGSLWCTDDPDEQEDILARKFFETIQPLVEHETPIYLLDFPRLALSAAYSFSTLAPLLVEHGVEEAEFIAAHNATARPEFIHSF
jgi:hypothetical protein